MKKSALLLGVLAVSLHFSNAFACMEGGASLRSENPVAGQTSPENKPSISAGKAVLMVYQNLHYTGEVLRVFENSVAEVQWKTVDGVPMCSKPSYHELSTLKPEVSCLGKFRQEKTVYGKTAGHHCTGKVLRVFEGGIAEVQWLTIDGSTVNNNPSYRDVSELFGLVGECSE